MDIRAELLTGYIIQHYISHRKLIISTKDYKGLQVYRKCLIAEDIHIQTD